MQECWPEGYRRYQLQAPSKITYSSGYLQQVALHQVRSADFGLRSIILLVPSGPRLLLHLGEQDLILRVLIHADVIRSPGAGWMMSPSLFGDGKSWMLDVHW